MKSKHNKIVFYLVLILIFLPATLFLIAVVVIDLNTSDERPTYVTSNFRHTTSPDGLECVFIEHPVSHQVFGVSCNYAKFNQQKDL